jgi:hypothetical protein
VRRARAESRGDAGHEVARRRARRQLDEHGAQRTGASADVGASEGGRQPERASSVGIEGREVVAHATGGGDGGERAMVAGVGEEACGGVGGEHDATVAPTRGGTGTVRARGASRACADGVACRFVATIGTATARGVLRGAASTLTLPPESDPAGHPPRVACLTSTFRWPLRPPRLAVLPRPGRMGSASWTGRPSRTAPPRVASRARS